MLLTLSHNTVQVADPAYMPQDHLYQKSFPATVCLLSRLLFHLPQYLLCYRYQRQLLLRLHHFLHPVFLPGLQPSVGHRQQSLPVRSQVYPDLHRQMRHLICHGSKRILPVQPFLPHSKNQAAGCQQLLFHLLRSLPLLPVHLLHGSAVCFRLHLSGNPVYRYFQLHRH